MRRLSRPKAKLRQSLEPIVMPVKTSVECVMCLRPIPFRTFSMSCRSDKKVRFCSKLCSQLHKARQKIGKIPPFKLGDAVSIRIGPYKGQDGTVISFEDGHPRQWVMVMTASSESLMFDWIELEKK